MSSPMPLAGKRWIVIIPVVMVMYLLAYLDRGNVAMILPYAGPELKLTSSAKGIVSGIFFLGYVVLQVPVVLLARRWGTRPVISGLITGWALSAAACGLVQNDIQLYVARFMLGVFEGGVLPIVIMLLSRWFVESERGRANTLFLTCVPLSSVLSSPFTGWLLTMMHWRTIFVIEGIMPLVWLVPWLLLIREQPTRAWWLPTTDGTRVQLLIDDEQRVKKSAGRTSYRELLRNRVVWQLITVIFLWFAASYGVVLWLPTVIKAMSADSSALRIGILSAAPYLVALVGMLVVIRFSDRGAARAWVAIPLATAGIALLATQVTSGVLVHMTLLCVVAIGSNMSMGTFMAVPSGMFPDAFAALALASMTTLGSVGGFMGPFLFGWLTDLTGSSLWGFIALGVCFLGAAALAAFTITSGKHAAAPIPAANFADETT
ncbi:MFS transporter [Nocardia jiangxiensis]|uniref:MFS transporter n=1 Tax=Nocardia jiangxiensis TaxID=282685 RepID=A0ABW6SCD1_9NOCA|nr:MFS transporter [Nocardia jiangxiensis]